MIKSKRIFHYLVLTSMFSFFTFTFTNLLLMFNSALGRMLNGTFLDLFMNMVSLFINLIFTALRYLSFVFFIGATIGLFIVFYIDFVRGEEVR